MLKSIVQNTALVLALAVGATITGLLARFMHAPTGAWGPTMIGSESIVAAAFAVVASVVVATALGIAVGKVSNAVVGCFVAGGVLFGIAWRTGTVVDVAVAPIAIAIEALVVAALVFGAVLVIFRVVGPLPDVEPTEYGERPDPVRSRDALRSAAAGVLMIPAVWLVAQSTLPGQAIGAAFCGGVVSGLAGRLVAPHVQPMLVFVSPIVFGAIGIVVGSFLLHDPFHEAALTGTVPNLLRTMPLHLAAGTLMGVAWGVGWAKSFLHHEESEDEQKAAPQAG